MPRRVVTYPANLQALNDWVSVSAFVLGLSMLVFLVNLDLVDADQARAARRPTRGTRKSAEWQLPTPVPLHDFDRFPVFDDDPYPYGVEPAPVPAPAPPEGA